MSEREVVDLADQLGRLRDFYENAPNMLFSVDAKTSLIRDCNETTLQALGRRREDVIGTAIAQVYHPDCLNTVEEAFHELLSTGSASAHGLRIVRADGTTLPVSLRETAQRGADGEILCTRSIWRDESDQQSEVEALRLEAREQAIQRRDSLAVLAGGIAHDFNNLLVGILGNAGLALMQIDESSPLAPTLRKIESASQHATELVQQMLAYSGRGRTTTETFDLATLVDEMTDLIWQALNPLARLRLEHDTSSSQISGDPTEIRQMVMNLIKNASDAIQTRGGTITIRTGRIWPDQDILDGIYNAEELSPGEYGLLEVRDNGSGMPREVRERMFDPFFSTKQGGRGLGLAAMLGTVRTHGGSIQVQSQVGEGTTVTVLLPLSRADRVESKVEDFAKPLGSARDTSKVIKAEAVALDGSTGKILVIDDNVEVGEVIASILTRAGFEVITATSGTRGIAEFRACGDELIATFVDYAMPYMSGRVVYAHLRRMDPDPVVVLMSGYSREEALQGLSPNPKLHFLAKPFLPKDVLELVARAQQVQRQRSSSRQA